MRTLILAALAAGSVTATSAGAVVTTFATYTQIGTGSTLRNSRTGATSDNFFTIGTPTSSQAGSVLVRFNFLAPQLVAAGLTDLSARMTLSSTQTGNAATNMFGFIIQPGYTGSFSFIYAGTDPLVVGNQTYTTGANLLSGSFGQASIIGATGSSSGNFSASTESGSAVTFTSDVLDFSNAVNNDIALTLTSIIPALGAQPNRALNTFRAAGTGSFSTEPLPTVIGLVPEPATWAMLVLGFGSIGVSLRRRRTLSLA